MDAKVKEEPVYRWREGFHPPKGVSAEVAWRAVEKTPDPDDLLHAAKRVRHPLHNHLFAEGDQVWAQKARREECRRIVGALQTDIVLKGGEIITTRCVEYLPADPGNEAGYYTVGEIASDQEKMMRLFKEVGRLQQQAMDKLALVEALMRRI